MKGRVPKVSSKGKYAVGELNKYYSSFAVAVVAELA